MFKYLILYGESAKFVRDKKFEIGLEMFTSFFITSFLNTYFRALKKRKWNQIKNPFFFSKHQYNVHKVQKVENQCFKKTNF